MKQNNQYKVLLVLLILVAFQQSCKNSTSSTEETNSITSIFTPDKFDADKIVEALKLKLETATIIENFSKVDSNVKVFKEFYTLNNYNPVWIHKDGLSKKSLAYLQVLDSLKYDALNPEDYHFSNLEARIKTIESEKNLDSIIQFELDMTHSFFKASQDLALGNKRLMNDNKEWKNKNDTLFNELTFLKACVDSLSVTNAFESIRPNHPWYKKFKEEYVRLLANTSSISMIGINDLHDSIADGFSSPSIAILRKKLFHEVEQPTDTTSLVWNNDVLEGVKKFQFKNQIKPTGKIDSTTLKALSGKADDKLKKVALNMERMRWLRHDFKQPFIWVCVPKMELDYYNKDSVEFNMRVVVGRKGRETPTLDAKIENIVFSPPWGVPPTIMKEEIVPGIARRGGSYLSRRGLKATDARGRAVNPSSINASNYKRFNISQAPGYRSSLGEVKFNMPNPWAIYLHDTPHREDFVKSYRAYSSGCIRVHKPKQFAEFLIQDTTLYSYNKIDSICKMRKTIFYPMKREINVHIVYLTNAIDSLGNIMYLKDVYGWDKN